MFEFVRTHTRLFLFILVVLIIPSFVFFGIQGYDRMDAGGNAKVAEVAGRPVTQAEWDAMHRDQIERVRRQMPGVDAKLFDTPQMRQQSLDLLVRDRVLLAAADDANLVITDDYMDRLFKTDPQFAALRNPDGSVNKDILAAQGMSSDLFAYRLRQDLAKRQVLQGVSDTALAPPAVAAATLDAFFQQREAQVLRFDTKDYLAKVSPTDAEIEQYYKDPAHAAQFQAPEQATIEYVVLDVEALKKDVVVTDEKLKEYYDQNIAHYSTPEERRASHILVQADKSAPAEVREKAKAKAESLLAELKKSPALFAELAKKHSDDPGSAERGGDLDFFGRGAMVKPFEDAAFALKPGETSDVVESDFGYHIIRTTAVRGGDRRSFEDVRPQLEEEVRKQLAQQKFSEIAVDFSNMVYEQPDSLKPVVDKFKLELRTAQGVTRTPAPGTAAPLNDAKFLEALFSAEALRNKRNTDAVETSPNQLVSGRVVQHTPARTLPLADVKDKVGAAVARQQAAAQARKEGEARLAEAKKDPKAALAVAAQMVSRVQTRELPREVIDAVLGADPSALPTAVGVNLGDAGYAVARVMQITGRDPVAADTARGQTQYAQAWGDAETQAYYEALKGRLGVEIFAPAAPAAPAAPVN
ncbi:peptidylprolyl isomerase [Piscinibacter sp.]|uniref:peptidylprolyl isomerase n=1 Tax=Piscinibacter sp. TaxID=1903157 RepID=UPI002CA0FD2F|nr:SurA N-terminal domain-containing protein [Albitalea sp.]HUG25856.1 SurA N-terminal domain-containing protein [Albitalea sp.]